MQPIPEETAPVQPGEVECFWDVAKAHARLNPVPGYFGVTPLEAVTPPAFSLGDDPAGANEAVRDLVVSGETALTTAREEFPSDDDLPSDGALGIVLDGQGHPRVLVMTTNVTVDDAVVVEHLKVVYSA